MERRVPVERRGAKRIRPSKPRPSIALNRSENPDPAPIADRFEATPTRRRMSQLFVPLSLRYRNPGSGGRVPSM